MVPRLRTCGSPMPSANAARAGIAPFTADDEIVAVHLDALELGDACQVDQVGRRRQALFHGRKQGLTAGHEFDVRAGAERLGGVGERGRALIIEGLHRIVLPYSAAALALLMACHT